MREAHSYDIAVDVGRCRRSSIGDGRQKETLSIDYSLPTIPHRGRIALLVALAMFGG